MRPTILLVGNFISSKGKNRTMAEELAYRLADKGYSLITTSSMHARLLRLLDMLFTTFIRRKDYQVGYVAVFSGLSFIWAEAVCGLLSILNKPFILTLNGGNLPVFAQRWPGRVKRLLRAAKAVNAPSRYLLLKMCKIRDDILLIPNPLDINLYSFQLRSMPSPHIIWLRAFHGIYNPQMAPLIIAELRETFPEIKLIMVGPDKGDGALRLTQDQIRNTGLDKSITIIKGIPKTQVPEVLNQGDVFINTTNIDNTPVSVIEAMACGLCIVSTNVGGIPYLLEDEKDALLVPPGDVKAMSTAITRILTEPSLAEKLSHNARKKAETFDWSIVFPQWESLFQKTAEK